MRINKTRNKRENEKGEGLNYAREIERNPSRLRARLTWEIRRARERREKYLAKKNDGRLIVARRALRFYWD